MAIIKCKMCGGDLVLIEGQSVAECEYCGSRQTVPVADNEKKLTLFARANRLRASCEFDKAAGIYESIVADFPEEAEAYWGLVLCKYGIEYVDDPATGRKIPTCHRSSFDSIMDDANFEQALENADAVARKVYREEAKQIEEIRKGIIAVSSNEQPYDIFICYKETDENGERTLDSVLAQDIYDTLVSRDYRTFFARITLEDKLGMEYEPYIFAALNSAKIMLAIGTDYEYYNAVWVKNEWSRYLKLMTQDKTKHLIPCYKGIDAYDMPKEFARLQAQDLGKVGAMQDLMRGIEKILPKKNTTVIQERVVVGGGGDNKIASLLDRGNMALEDGDWAKADSFFEDVLNNDSKNAQAYIGKTLAQEKCRTMDAFVRKRKGLYETVKGQKLALEPNTKHIEEVADQCRIPNYLTDEEIRNLYQFNLHYHSDVAERRQQYQKEESYWANHKLLSRAEKFAVGAVAENLQREKKALFAALSEQVKKAESTETGHKQSVQERYAQHIAQMDTKAAELHCEAVAQREQDYRDWVTKVKNTEDLETLRNAESFFTNQGDYQKCPALAVHCQKRIADITEENERKATEARAAAEAEAERKRIAKAKADAARKKKNKTIAVMTVIVIVLAIAAGIVLTTVVIPNSKLNKAQALLDNGDYQAAYDQLMELGEYKNSAELLDEIAEHGAYLPVSATIGGDGFNDNRHDEYQYNEKGLPAFIVSTNEEKDTVTKYALQYTYYDSGRIQTCTVLRDEIVVYEMRFHDIDLNRVEFGDYNWADWAPEEFVKVHDFRFYGVAEWVSYNIHGEDPDTNTKSADGVNTIYTVTRDEEGRIISKTDKENGKAYNYTYNADGTIQSYGGSGMSGYEYSYVYTAGQLTEWSIKQSYKDYPTYKERYSYDTFGNVSEHTWWYASDGHLELGSENTYKWEWLDFAVLEEQMAERLEKEAEEQAKLDEQQAADYAAAENLCQAGKYMEAAQAFSALGTYADAPQRVMQLWGMIANRETVSADISTTMAVRNDGTVVYAGNTAFHKDEVANWTDVIAISQGNKITLGLKSNGTVVGVGEDVFSPEYLPSITNAVDIVAADKHYLVLLADGTLAGEGFNDYGQLNVADWTNVIAIDATLNFSVGLRADGTVLFAGDNEYGQQAVTGWTDIVEIDVGHSCVFGRKSDGTVVSTKNTGDFYQWGQDDVSDWSNIVDIAAGSTHTVGLRADGTVVAVGRNDDGECNVSGWHNIVAVFAGDDCTIGLKADGTLVTTGKDNFGELVLTSWSDIRLPE